MNDLQIYFTDTSELAEYEALNRGHRNDVYVKLLDSYYLLSIYDIERLKQDVDTEIKEYGAYSSEPNLVISKSLSRSDILETIEKLYKQKYFEFIKPIKHSTIVNQLNKVY